jgi:hypothetical protein
MFVNRSLVQLNKNHKVICESEYSELDMCWLIDAKYEIINYKFLSRHISMVELKISNCMQLLLVGVWTPFDDNKLETRARIETLYSEIESLLNNADMDSVIIVISIFSECQTYRTKPSKYCS